MAVGGMKTGTQPVQIEPQCRQTLWDLIILPFGDAQRRSLPVWVNVDAQNRQKLP